MPAVAGRLRRLLLRVAWLLIAAVLALGGAGIVAGGEHLPGAARPELTWAADRAIAPGLAAARADLVRISGEVDRLGQLGRDALAALTRQDLAALASAIDDGSALVAQVDRESQALRTRLEALPGGGVGVEQRLGPAALARYDDTVLALSATEGLSASWASLAQGSVAASQLAALLAAHDAAAGEAARLGSKAEYTAALKSLATASSDLAQAAKLRDELAQTGVDTSTLTLWIERNAALDTALGSLYTALITSKGQATAAVRSALAAEQAAQANLPPDTRGLVVIMSDVARGGLNQAVIAIEDARGALAASLDQLAGASVTPAP